MSFDAPLPLDPAQGDLEHADGSGHPDVRRGMRRSILSLLLLASLTFFLGLGRPAITDSDEGFYAEAAREMVESGDWLTPHFNYTDRWQKPALYYWLTAATYLVLGPTELAARLWAALSGVGLVLVTWMAARSLMPGPKGLIPGPNQPPLKLRPSARTVRGSGASRQRWRVGSHGDPTPAKAERPGLRENAAWLAGAIVATCFGCFAMARAALPDLPLAFLITVTIWAALERRSVLAGAAAGLGFIMKGPLAVAIPAIVLVPIWWREGHFRALRARDVVLSAVAFAALGLPWYLAMTFEHGLAYLDSFFVGDNLERFATDRFNEPRPIWFYVPIVIGGMLPWSMYMLILPWGWVRDVVRRTRAATAAEWRLLLWAAVPLLFFTMSIGKQPRYILPVLPPIAVLAARSIAARVHDADRAPLTPLALATWATALLYATLAVLLVRAEPLFVNASPALTYAGIAVIGLCAVALATLAATRRWRLLPMAMGVCATVLLLSLQFGALAGARPEPVERLAALVRANRSSGEPVGTYQVMVRNLVFYTRFEQVDLSDEGRALDFLRSPERVLLVVRAADLPRLEAIAGIMAVRLGEVDYLNTANIRLRTLVAPLPEQDLDRVLLVANR